MIIFHALIIWHVSYIFRAIAKEILLGQKNMKEALECEWISKDETSTTPFKELIKRIPGNKCNTALMSDISP